MKRALRVLACLGVIAVAAAAVPDSATAMTSAGDRFRMPNVVGMVLQDAQDLLQSRGSYLMDQEDARGLGRWQLLDSGWKVCAQRPLPGAKVRTSAVVTLWSVKLSERCPQ